MNKIIHKILELEYFTGDNPVLPAYYTPSSSHLLLLIGDNATGKSFFARLFAAYNYYYHTKTEPILVNMSLRTYGGIERAFVFGDESRESTGTISLQSVIKGIATCRSREKNHYLIYDEPDVGLSEGYQMALGRYVAKFMQELPSKTKGVVISTHSKHLVRPLLDYNPQHIRFGDRLSLNEWLEQEPKEKSEEELLSLHERSFSSYRAILDVVKAMEREKERKKRKRIA